MHNPPIIPIDCSTCVRPLGGMVCNEGITVCFCPICRAYIIYACKDGKFSKRTTLDPAHAIAIMDEMKAEMEDIEPKYDGIRHLELD